MTNAALQQSWHFCPRFKNEWQSVSGFFIDISRLSFSKAVSTWDHCWAIDLTLNLQFHVSGTLSLISIQHGPAHFPIAPTKKTKQFQKELQGLLRQSRKTQKWAKWIQKLWTGRERLVTASSSRHRTAFLATVRQAFCIIPCEVHTSSSAMYVLAHTYPFISTHEILKQSWSVSNRVVDANLMPNNNWWKKRADANKTFFWWVSADSQRDDEPI